jgi:hypothetical protein
VHTTITEVEAEVDIEVVLIDTFSSYSLFSFVMQLKVLGRLQWFKKDFLGLLIALVLCSIWMSYSILDSSFSGIDFLLFWVSRRSTGRSC